MLPKPTDLKVPPMTLGDLGGLFEAIEHRCADVDIEPGKITRYKEIEAKLRAALEGEAGGHRIEIVWDGHGFGSPHLTLHHPETGCDPGEEGRPGTCWLDGWLENDDEPEAMLRGTLSVAVTYELDGDHPVFYLQPSATPPVSEGEADLRAQAEDEADVRLEQAESALKEIRDTPVTGSGAEWVAWAREVAAIVLPAGPTEGEG